MVVDANQNIIPRANDTPLASSRYMYSGSQAKLFQVAKICSEKNYHSKKGTYHRQHQK